MTPAQQQMSDRLDDAVWEALNDVSAAARAEPPPDEFQGMRLRPEFRAVLAYLYRPSSPLRRPGPRGQLGLPGAS